MTRQLKESYSDAPSSWYQYKFYESSTEDSFLCNLIDNGCYAKIEDDPMEKDRKEELKERLLLEVLRIMSETLTEMQLKCMTLYYFSDLTQVEVSKELGISKQACVHKCIFGNVQYRKHYVSKYSPSNCKGEKYDKPKRFGGALKKLREACEEDEVIQDILKQINEPNED